MPARSASRRSARRELEPVKKLAFEDITALGTELQALDLELAGHELDEGAERRLPAGARRLRVREDRGDKITEPDHIKHVTEILDDGRYAIACVRARVAGEPLPTRRPPCFFDPRHGLSVTDVDYAPPGGAAPRVPACALDAERVRRGRRPRRPPGDGRLAADAVLAGRPAYAPYAAGYFGGFAPDEHAVRRAC